MIFNFWRVWTLRTWFSWCGRTALATLLFTSAIGPAVASAQSASALVEDFSSETVGVAPSSFSTPLGWWTVAPDPNGGTKPVLFEDGTRFATLNGRSDVATQAQAQAQGLSQHQLADSRQAYVPIALFNKVPNFTQGSVVARVAIVGGDLDTETGIIFNYQPNGDFLALRLDADEGEMQLYQVAQGQQSILSKVEGVPATLAQWHDLQLTVQPGGTHLTGFLDAQQFLDLDISIPVSGQVGVMSKNDSVVVFDSFLVDPAQ
jgi:hypothetical protein